VGGLAKILQKTQGDNCMPDPQPEAGLSVPDIQHAVAAARATLGDLKTILDQLDKARSVVCIIVNATDTPLTYDPARTHLAHGVFATNPPPFVAPQSSAAFSAQSSSGSVLTGTEGEVYYTGADGVRLRFYWNNPWRTDNGSNSEFVNPSNDSFRTELYQTWSETGGGDQNAQMLFVLFRPQYDIIGAIREKWLSLGGLAGFLGPALTNETATPDGVGRYNHFRGGGPANRASIYWTPQTGAHEIHGAIHDKWAALGWENGDLGYPTTDESGTPDGIGRFNHFLKGSTEGSIYWRAGIGAFEVHGAIREKWASMGWEGSPLGYPITDESGTSDGRGRYNHFDGGSIYWTPQTGAHEVHGDIHQKWKNMGWETSSLGYPITDEENDVVGVPGGRVSFFEHGSLHWNPKTRVVTVKTGLPVKHPAVPA
jgi:hypothetical protein